MNESVASGLFLAAGLLLFGCVTAYLQIRGRRQLAARRLIPSDELHYLSQRHRRRLATGCLISTIGLMIGTAFLSGMERRADNLGEVKAPTDPAAEKPPVADGDRLFVRLWGGFWIIVLLLVFAVIVLAMNDALATRRYWLAQFREIREDHEVKLRRDLAVYRKHKEQHRGGLGGNRLGGTTEGLED